MQAVIITDSERQPEARLSGELLSCLKDYEIEEFSVGRDDLACCTGCFGCWVKTPGQCVIRDGIAAINRAVMGSDVAFFLTPVVFGQFSANIKTVVDRGLPNILPFFIIRPDGSTMHPARYDSYPQYVMLGFGDSISAEDARLFIDITKKHRRGAEALVYSPKTSLENQLKGITLWKCEGLL